MDPDIANFVGDTPQLTFRRRQNLRDKLVHSHFSPPTPTGTWLDRQIQGCYRCSGYVACDYICRGPKFVGSVTNREFRIFHFINCRSMRVVYLITCSCGKQYVGKTLREFRRHIGEHLGDVRHNRDTPVARHVWTEHGGDPKCLQFQGIYLVLPSQRHGNLDRTLLQKESHWIFQLKTVAPKGMNKQLNYSCFI